jgi:hypothetical protein
MLEKETKQIAVFDAFPGEKFNGPAGASPEFDILAERWNTPCTGEEC